MGTEPGFGRDLSLLVPGVGWGGVGGQAGGARPLPRCSAGKFSGLSPGARCSPPGCGGCGVGGGAVPPRCPGSRGLRRAAPRGVGAGAPGGLSFPGDRPASGVPAPPGTPRDPNPSLPLLHNRSASLTPFLACFRLLGPFLESFKGDAIWGEAVVLGGCVGLLPVSRVPK